MKAVVRIAQDVLLEARRNQFFHLSLVIAFLLLFLFTFLSTTDEALRGKLFVEGGISVLWLIHFLLAVFLVTESYYAEQEGKSIYFYLVRNVSRLEYLAGKFLGLSLALCLSTVFTGAILLACAALLKALTIKIVYGLFYLMLELSLSVAVLLFLSTLFTKLITVFVFVFLFFFSSFLELIQLGSSWPDWMKILLFTIPNYKYYSWLETVVHAKETGWLYPAFLSVYTLSMVLFYLLASAWQFRRKEL